MSNAVENRIIKNWSKLKAQATQYGLEAFRLYERDIPEYPFIVDVYAMDAVVYDRSNAVLDADKTHHIEHLLKALQKIGLKEIFVKQRHSGKHQYGRLSEESYSLVVKEGPASFRVNLSDYLDTGLFLDHRIMRGKISKEAKNKKFLNLFSYTGSVSVFAALGGATEVVSVDLSNTYTEWAKENFKLNDLSLSPHRFVVEDVLQYLRGNSDLAYFDLIFIDPPTFSNSKSMASSFEVEREQQLLIERCMTKLVTGGIMYFSTNKRDFKLSDEIKTVYNPEDISRKTIPFDFRDQKIHKVFRFQKVNATRSVMASWDFDNNS